MHKHTGYLKRARVGSKHRYNLANVKNKIDVATVKNRQAPIQHDRGNQYQNKRADFKRSKLRVTGYSTT